MWIKEGYQSQMTGEVKKRKVKYSTKHHMRSKCLVPSPTWEGRVVWGWLGVRNPNVVVVDVKVGGVGRRGNLNKMMLNSTRIQNMVRKIPACVGIDHFRGLSICPSVYKLVTIGYRRALVHRIRIFTKKNLRHNGRTSCIGVANLPFSQMHYTLLTICGFPPCT